jgi:hypothetical protein
VGSVRVVKYKTVYILKVLQPVNLHPQEQGFYIASVS